MADPLTPMQFMSAIMAVHPSMKEIAKDMVTIVECMDNLSGMQRLDVLNYLENRYVITSPKEVSTSESAND